VGRSAAFDADDTTVRPNRAVPGRLQALIGPHASGTRLFEVRELAATDEQSDGSRLAECALDESTLFEGYDHPMRGRRRDLEVPLQVGLCGRPALHLRVVVDVYEVLSLLLRVARRREARAKADGRWVVGVGFLDVAQPVAEPFETLPKSGVVRMVGLCRYMPEEIIEVIESEANDDGSAIRFRDAKLPLKLAIDEGVFKDQIALSRTEPDRDSLSGLDHLDTHLAPTLTARSSYTKAASPRPRRQQLLQHSSSGFPLCLVMLGNGSRTRDKCNRRTDWMVEENSRHASELARRRLMLVEFGLPVSFDRQWMRGATADLLPGDHDGENPLSCFFGVQASHLQRSETEGHSRQANVPSAECRFVQDADGFLFTNFVRVEDYGERPSSIASGWKIDLDCRSPCLLAQIFLFPNAGNSPVRTPDRLQPQNESPRVKTDSRHFPVLSLRIRDSHPRHPKHGHSAIGFLCRGRDVRPTDGCASPLLVESVVQSGATTCTYSSGTPEKRPSISCFFFLLDRSALMMFPLPAVQPVFRGTPCRSTTFDNISLMDPSPANWNRN